MAFKVWSSLSGITRAVSTISEGLPKKAIVITDKFYKPSTSGFRILCKTYKVNLMTHSVFSLLRDFIKASISTFLISRTERLGVLNPHTPLSLLISCGAKLLNRKLKISWLLYDREFLQPPSLLGIFIMHTVKVLLKIQFIDQILVLDNNINKLTRKAFKVRNVYTIRLGVSRSMFDHYERFTSGLIDEHTFSWKVYMHDAYINVLFHGILMPRRKIETLLLAISRMRKELQERVRVYISGSTVFNIHYSKKLLKMTEALGLNDQIHFLGSLSEEELVHMYAACDIFVWPCNKQTWGIAPLEAMLFGKPIVVSSGAGVSEILDEDIGMIFPFEDIQKLTSCLESLIINQNLRINLGRRATKLVKERYTYLNTARHLEQLWGL